MLEDGGSEDEAIAALLHDAVEDHPRDGNTVEEIRMLFGERVLRIVLGCTDADEHPKPPWRKRQLAPQAPATAPADVRGWLPRTSCTTPGRSSTTTATWASGSGAGSTPGRRTSLVPRRAGEGLKGRGRRGPLVRELGRVVRELEQAVEEGEG